MTGMLTLAQVRQVRAMDPDELVGRMVEAARFENGRWDEDVAADVLLARIELERQCSLTLAREGVEA